MRVFNGIVARIGNQGALANARQEIESSRLSRARVDALARRLDGSRARRVRRSGAA